MIFKETEKLKRCPKHPKYTGRREPKFACAECYQVRFEYMKYHPRHQFIRPDQVIPSEKVYKRKPKHKKRYDEE